MNGDRWEHGSEFHFAEFEALEDREVPPWERGVLLGSGRDALRLLVAHGFAARGWERLWVPSYLCQEVVASLRGAGPIVTIYADDPRVPIPDLSGARLGDAVLHVNYFGMRDGPSLRVPDGVDLVEDHTHDPISPWAGASTADFCVASLRKTLPVPDGGALWSPRGHELPKTPPVTKERAQASASKLAAMLLKGLHLAGHAVAKEAFRRLALKGEAGIASGPVSGMPPSTVSLLNSLPMSRWRETRRQNHEQLAARLRQVRWLSVLQKASPRCAPYSVVVVTDEPQRREFVRQRLIERRVYPAVLWPLEGPVLDIPEKSRALSRRIMSFHCDMRYGEHDLARVAREIEEAGAA